jgi:uncharacterized protein YutD
MLSRLKFEIGGLFQEIYDERLPETLFMSETTTFADIQSAGLQAIIPIVNKLRQYGHSDENIRGRVFAFCEDELDLNSVQFDFSDVPVTFDIYKESIDMKFDVLVGNDPYQEKVGPKKTEPLWNKFFMKRMSLLKEGGFMCLIHPSGWRNITGKFKDVQEVIRSKKVSFLSIHNEKDGMETFGAETRYDYYVLQNVDNDGSETMVRFQDGQVKNMVLDNMDFIPNGGIDLLNTLLAKKGEETVELLYSRSGYGTDKLHTSKEQNDEFIFPVVYTVNYLSEPTFYYSSTNQNGHFGKPKVIWSNGRISSIGNYIDETGEFGLTQFAYAIVDEVENLENIKKALDSKKFKNLMELCAVGQLTVNHKVVAKFKKDFWKKFIDE